MEHRSRPSASLKLRILHKLRPTHKCGNASICGDFSHPGIYDVWRVILTSSGDSDWAHRQTLRLVCRAFNNILRHSSAMWQSCTKLQVVSYRNRTKINSILMQPKAAFIFFSEVLPYWRHLSEVDVRLLQDSGLQKDTCFKVLDWFATHRPKTELSHLALRMMPMNELTSILNIVRSYAHCLRSLDLGAVKLKDEQDCLELLTVLSLCTRLRSLAVTIMLPFTRAEPIAPLFVNVCKPMPLDDKLSISIDDCHGLRAVDFVRMLKEHDIKHLEMTTVGGVTQICAVHEIVRELPSDRWNHLRRLSINFFAPGIAAHGADMCDDHSSMLLTLATHCHSIEMMEVILEYNDTQQPRSIAIGSLASIVMAMLANSNGRNTVLRLSRSQLGHPSLLKGELQFYGLRYVDMFNCCAHRQGMASDLDHLIVYDTNASLEVCIPTCGIVPSTELRKPSKSVTSARRKWWKKIVP